MTWNLLKRFWTLEKWDTFFIFTLIFVAEMSSSWRAHTSLQHLKFAFKKKLKSLPGTTVIHFINPPFPSPNICSTVCLTTEKVLYIIDAVCISFSLFCHSQCFFKFFILKKLICLEDCGIFFYWPNPVSELISLK